MLYHGHCHGCENQVRFGLNFCNRCEFKALYSNLPDLHSSGLTSEELVKLLDAIRDTEPEAYTEMIYTKCINYYNSGYEDAYKIAYNQAITDCMCTCNMRDITFKDDLKKLLIK